MMDFYGDPNAHFFSYIKHYCKTPQMKHEKYSKMIQYILKHNHFILPRLENSTKPINI